MAKAAAPLMLKFGELLRMQGDEDEEQEHVNERLLKEPLKHAEGAPETDEDVSDIGGTAGTRDECHKTWREVG
jgi:hypothetical protein